MIYAYNGGSRFVAIMSFSGSADNKNNFAHYMETRNFPPEPSTPKQARKFVRDTLSTWNWSALEEVATLLASELVTNSVMHARSWVRVNIYKESEYIRKESEYIRIEVVDAQANTLPKIRNYGLESTTGRGLLLLKSMSKAWGVEVIPQGKVVWFELENDSATEDKTICLKNFSLGCYINLQQYIESLLREFSLIRLSPKKFSSPISDSFMSNFLELRKDSRIILEKINSYIEAAQVGGYETIELCINLPKNTGNIAYQLNNMLDEADFYCKNQYLLTITPSEELISFRKWYFNQIYSQLIRGEYPLAWS